LDPENPEVLLLQADLTEEDDVRLSILVHAIENARSVLREEGIPEEDLVAIGAAVAASLGHKAKVRAVRFRSQSGWVQATREQSHNRAVPHVR